MPSATTILTAIRDVLRAVHTNYDLSTASSTTRVDIGDPILQPGTAAPPYVWLSPPTIGSAYEAIALGMYRMECRSEIVGIVAAEGLTPEDRCVAAIKLADDIVTAIQGGHGDSGNATLYNIPELLVQVTDILGGGVVDGIEYGIVVGHVTWVTHLERGV